MNGKYSGANEIFEAAILKVLENSSSKKEKKRGFLGLFKKKKEEEEKVKLSKPEGFTAGIHIGYDKEEKSFEFMNLPEEWEFIMRSAKILN